MGKLLPAQPCHQFLLKKTITSMRQQRRGSWIQNKLRGEVKATLKVSCWENRDSTDVIDVY